MKPKYPAQIILQIFEFIVLFCWFIKPSLAVEYQNCSVSQNCTIGEFLYDDNYVPIATATCTLTSRYPDGTVFLNAVAMNASSSGWYSYTSAIGATEGIYPSQICCTATPDYLCLDKTFKVVTPTSSGASAADIWGYSDRSLTSFGTLVADIWNNSTRSLTSFGDLISNIWSKDSRTLTNSDTVSSTTNTANIAETKQVVKETRLLLEQLINKPIVKTFIDENPTPVLSVKIEQTKTATATLYSGVQNLKSRSLLLEEKWPTLTEDEIKSELNTLSSIFTQDIGQKDSNLIATTNWLKTSWNSPIMLDISDQAQIAKTQIDNLLSDIDLYGKPNDTDSFTNTLSHIQQLDDLIGTSLATSTDITLYGFIKKTSDRVAYLDTQSGEAIKILMEIKKDNNIDHTSDIARLTNDIISGNQLLGIDLFFSKSVKNTDTLTNKVLSLLAIVDTNRLLLASNTGQAVKNIWLEEGSIIFRSVAINPSHYISQKVSVKFFLPTEIKKEQIINHDPELTISYDSVENSLFASGDITLAPDETRTFLVEVEDIWNFKQEEINSLKIQVNDLTSVLKNTSYFAQATSIKSDIIVTLDKIMLRQNQAVTPENRIQTYRESSLEMNGVEEKINSLKDLVAQSNAAGGFLGFVGGVQSVSLWGIVLIIIAGFVFLTLYLNALRAEGKLSKVSETVAPKSESSLDENKEKDYQAPTHRHRETGHRLGHKITRVASIVLLAVGIGSIGVSSLVKASQSHTVALISPAPDATVLGAKDNSYPYQTSLKLPNVGSIPIHSLPSITAPKISSLKETGKIYVFRLLDNWAQIGMSEKDTDNGWWINTMYLE